MHVRTTPFWSYLSAGREATLAYDDVFKWKYFPRHRPFVRGIHRSPVNSPHKGQWRRAFMFSLICTWINGWVNNRDVGDLRRNRAHYDITVKWLLSTSTELKLSTHLSTHVLLMLKVLNMCLSGSMHVLTHLARDKFAAILPTTFQSIFPSLNEYWWIAFQVSLKFVPDSPVDNKPPLVQVMAWHRTGHRPLSEPSMAKLFGLNGLKCDWPSDHFFMERIDYQKDIVTKIDVSLYNQRWQPPVVIVAWLVCIICVTRPRLKWYTRNIQGF